MYAAVGRFLDSVPAVAVGYFREAARELIEQRGAEEALAAALAHISGATSLEQRSLISSDSVRQHHSKPFTQDLQTLSISLQQFSAVNTELGPGCESLNTVLGICVKLMSCPLRGSPP